MRVQALRERIEEAKAARDRAIRATADAERAEGEVKEIRIKHSRVVEHREQARVIYDGALAQRTDASAHFEQLRRLQDDAKRSSQAAEAAEARRTAAAKELELAQEAENQAHQRATDALAKLSAAETRATVARDDLTAAEASAATAKQHAERVGRLRGAAEDQRSVRDRLRDALASSRRRLEEERALADQAGQTQAELELRWRQIQTVAQAARREDAAAAAAKGCISGEPCPVCARELPDSFVPPPPSPMTSDAEAAERTAHNELEACRHVLARALANSEARAREEQRVALEFRDAEELLAETERALVSDNGADWEGIRDAAEAASSRLNEAQRVERAASESLAQSRAEVKATERTVEPLRAATSRAMSALETATGESDAAAAISEKARGAFVSAGGEDAFITANNDLVAATQQLAESKGPLDATRRSAEGAEGRLRSAEQRAAALGAAARGAVEEDRRAVDAVMNSVQAIPAEARQGAVSEPGNTEAVAGRWVAERRALIDEAQRCLVAAESDLNDAEGAGVSLRTRRVTDLEQPLSDAARIATRLAAIAEVHLPAADLSPTELVTWARAAAAETRDAAEDQRRAAEAADADVVAARAAAQRACEKLGLSRERLEEWRGETQREVGVATESRRQATATADRVRALDSALAGSAERSRVLNLARELCQGRGSFANHVLVARRQSLIAEAAAILAELSSGRLTFAEDVAATFGVLDTGSGSVRDPRLLSGGEQFQASLALALGLVEIAARAGSRIECLFLDEGFGALDPASLDTALDALESAARRGRRIVAVTHVDAVTARADQVLRVSGSESGSHAAWGGLGLSGYDLETVEP